MNRFVRVTLLVAALTLLSGPAAVGEPSGPRAAEIDRLVRQLGSESFQEREAASKALEEIGEPAFAALRTALRSDDAEVRRRAREIVRPDRLELYTDAEASRMAKKATGLIPRGMTKPKSEVLRALGIDPRRLSSGDRYAFMKVIIESWQVSSAYQIKWMADWKAVYWEDDCPIYGVEIQPIDKK